MMPVESSDNHPSLFCIDLCRHRHPKCEGNSLVSCPDGKTLGLQFDLINQIAASPYLRVKDGNPKDLLISD